MSETSPSPSPIAKLFERHPRPWKCEISGNCVCCIRDAARKLIHSSTGWEPSIIKAVVGIINSPQPSPLDLGKLRNHIMKMWDDVNSAKTEGDCKGHRDRAIAMIDAALAAPRGDEASKSRIVHSRETLGYVVRNAWIKWANTQPNPKPNWLIPWDELPESDKEADRCIGEAVAKFYSIPVDDPKPAPAPLSPKRKLREGDRVNNSSTTSHAIKRSDGWHYVNKHGVENPSALEWDYENEYERDGAWLCDENGHRLEEKPEPTAGDSMDELKKWVVAHGEISEVLHHISKFALDLTLATITSDGIPEEIRHRALTTHRQIVRFRQKYTLRSLGEIEHGVVDFAVESPKQGTALSQSEPTAEERLKVKDKLIGIRASARNTLTLLGGRLIDDCAEQLRHTDKWLTELIDSSEWTEIPTESESDIFNGPNNPSIEAIANHFLFDKQDHWSAALARHVQIISDRLEQQAQEPKTVRVDKVAFDKAIHCIKAASEASVSPPIFQNCLMALDLLTGGQK